MTKYKTKPIDYTGCHPIIAEHLRQGEAVLCKVWDGLISPNGTRSKIYICAYLKDYDCPYTDSEDGGWSNAEPIPASKRIMPAEMAIPVLIAEGWRFDSDGDLRNGIGLIRADTFWRMGKEDVHPAFDFPSYFPACIIEDVEE